MVAHALTTLYRALFSPAQDLRAREAESTFFRFFRSNHVSDLRLIALLAATAVVVHIVFLVGAAMLAHSGNTDAATATPAAGASSDGALEYFKFAVPLYCAVIAWAYLTASARLGIVDLFACEISSLCRVGTIFEVGKLYIKLTEAKPSVASGSYDPHEEYFTVFQNNAKDLQVLEASVVTNITEFYTYMKAMRDARRKLMQPDPSTPSRLHAEGAINVIFVLFLSYESARKAVDDLVEFQPSKAERTIVILLTELPCYAYLLAHFHKFAADDLRYERLKLREQDYKQEVVPELYDMVMQDHGENEKDWERAKHSIPALVKEYNEAFGADLDTVAKAMSRRNN